MNLVVSSILEYGREDSLKLTIWCLFQPLSFPYLQIWQFLRWTDYFTPYRIIISFDPALFIHFLALDGAAFASRMPANKMTQQEIEFFPDVAHGSQSAMLEFLYIRNRLLQMWINNPGSELTAEKAQNTVVLPQSGQDRVYMWERGERGREGE